MFRSNFKEIIRNNPLFFTQALRDHDKEKIKQRIRNGTDVWPWPEQKNPSSMYRIKELKKMNMVSLSLNQLEFFWIFT